VYKWSVWSVRRPRRSVCCVLQWLRKSTDAFNKRFQLQIRKVVRICGSRAKKKKKKHGLVLYISVLIVIKIINLSSLPLSPHLFISPSMHSSICLPTHPSTPPSLPPSLAPSLPPSFSSSSSSSSFSPSLLLSSLLSSPQGYMKEMQSPNLPDTLKGKEKLIFGNIQAVYEFHHG